MKTLSNSYKGESKLSKYVSVSKSSYSTTTTPPLEETLFMFSNICIMNNDYLIEGKLELCSIEGIVTLKYIPTLNLQTNSTMNLGEFEYILKVEHIESIEVLNTKIINSTTNKRFYQLHFKTQTHVFLIYPNFLFPTTSTIDILIEQINMNGFKCILSHPIKKDVFPIIYQVKKQILDSEHSQVHTPVPIYPKHKENESIMTNDIDKVYKSLSLPLAIRHRSKSVSLNVNSKLNLQKSLEENPKRKSLKLTKEEVVKEELNGFSFEWSTLAVGEEIINPFTNDEIIRSNTFYSGLKENVRGFGWKKCLGGSYEELYFPSLIIVDYLNVINLEWWKRIKDNILKDIPRTEIDGIYFKRESQEFYKVKRILEAYCGSHSNIGFKQGMTDILAVILKVVDDEKQQFSLFCNIMEFISPFCDNNMESILTGFGYIIQTLDNELYNVIMNKCNGFVFVYQWLILLFKREFSLSNIFRIWDSIFAYPSRKFHLFIGASILLDHSQKIKSSEFRFDELLIYLQSLQGLLKTDIIYKADCNYKTFMEIASISVKRIVFGSDTLLLKNTKKGLSPTISQPASPKLYHVDNVNSDVINQIKIKIGTEPFIHPLPQNPTQSQLQLHLIEICDHDNWCRKLNYELNISHLNK
ncbi:TBC domain containing protein [Entamoeba nuttalli P19]|uniref:TBC domain containing protein n=1 Tax=Entamoeba nuttalli (strain P19) TaxID=1076696 RepID=K2H5D9_ENTNP|nr:TBC domain containing protein [Entamoeba nuttalli P19]EKE42813.1 TBC domain containing protein [Entamoeba nuttalli P19]|eukprot:XP_008854852.1 TBC domain containing protein [Entamoeba nuttalli P19]